jgi:hypothetical protein
MDKGAFKSQCESNDNGAKNHYLDNTAGNGVLSYLVV